MLQKQRSVHPTRYALLVGALLAGGCFPHPNSTLPVGSSGKATLSGLSTSTGNNATSQTGTSSTSSSSDNSSAGIAPPPGLNPVLPPSQPTGPQPLPPPFTTLPTTPTTTGTLVGGASGVGFATLLGGVSVPAIISNNGSAIISNNGSAIISNNGSAIISNNGSAIISNNGSALVSNNGSGYRVMDASGAEVLLKNAFLYLTNRDEKFYRNTQTNQPFVATTDSNGNFTFNGSTSNGFPLSQETVVNAIVDGDLRLTGYLTPLQGQTSLTLTLGSTLGTEYLRGIAYAANRSMSSYPINTVSQISALNEQAINQGDIAAIRTLTDQTGATAAVNVFDLRIDHVNSLRNQYVTAISAVPSTDTLIKSISDAWKSLIGTRPMAVSTLIGNGNMAVVTEGPYGSKVTGDDRASAFSSASPPPAIPYRDPAKVPLGFAWGVTTDTAGDTFITSYTQAANSGNIRWIKPDGTITSVWISSFTLSAPIGICVEYQPGEQCPYYNNATMGTLLVCDAATNIVWRVPIVETPNTPNGVTVDYPNYFSQITYPMKPVAGEYYPIMDANEGDYGDDAGHPAYNSYSAIDPTAAASSAWRVSDEGPRTYPSVDASAYANPHSVATGTPGVAIPNPARYAHLANPMDVKVDDLKNIYIADNDNQRVRMIVSQQGASYLQAHGMKTFYGYRDPVVSNGLVTGFQINPALQSTMQAGCIYTIAGNPTFHANALNTPSTARWYGDYSVPADGMGQEALLDQPDGLAWNPLNNSLYIAEFDNQHVRRIDRNSGQLTNVAGSAAGPQIGSGSDWNLPLASKPNAGDGGQATSAQLSNPRGIAIDGKGRLFIADTSANLIRMVDTNGVISTVAGRVQPSGQSPTDDVTDGDALNWVDLYSTNYLAIDPNGNVVLTDNRHYRVRKLWRQWEY